LRDSMRFEPLSVKIRQEIWARAPE